MRRSVWKIENLLRRSVQKVRTRVKKISAICFNLLIWYTNWATTDNGIPLSTIAGVVNTCSLKLRKELRIELNGSRYFNWSNISIFLRVEVHFYNEENKKSWSLTNIFLSISISIWGMRNEEQRASSSPIIIDISFEEEYIGYAKLIFRGEG